MTLHTCVCSPERRGLSILRRLRHVQWHFERPLEWHSWQSPLQDLSYRRWAHWSFACASLQHGPKRTWRRNRWANVIKCGEWLHQNHRVIMNMSQNDETLTSYLLGSETFAHIPVWWEVSYNVRLTLYETSTDIQYSPFRKSKQLNTRHLAN